MTGKFGSIKPNRREHIVVITDHPAQHVEFLRTQFVGLPIDGISDLSQLESNLKDLAPTVAICAFHSNWNRHHATQLFQAPSLGWVHHFGSGMDAFPSPPIGVALSNSAGILAHLIAEYVLGSIMMLELQWPQYQAQQTDHIWAKHRRRELRDSTLLVIGLGHIGKEVARLATGLGLKVRGIRRVARPETNLKKVYDLDDLAEALAWADYVSLHLPLTASTSGLLDGAMLARMKPSAVLINTARGGVIDEDAMRQRLTDGRLRAAVLDVFEDEPLPADSKLWDTPNLYLTPHCSQYAHSNTARLLAFAAENIALYLDEKPLRNLVFLE